MTSLGTPAYFNGFRVLASLLHRRRSTEVNQTLNDVWPSPGLIHYIFILGGSCPVTKFCQVQNSLRPSLARSPILAALLHGTRAVRVSQTLRRGIFTRQGVNNKSTTKRSERMYSANVQRAVCCLTVCPSVRHVDVPTVSTIKQSTLDCRHGISFFQHQIWNRRFPRRQH